jgi:hypothetical protein
LDLLPWKLVARVRAYKKAALFKCLRRSNKRQTAADRLR